MFFQTLTWFNGISLILFEYITAWRVWCSKLYIFKYVPFIYFSSFLFLIFLTFWVLIQNTVASCSRSILVQYWQIFYSFLIWEKLFKNWPSKICGRQPLKKFTWSILEYFVLYIATIFWETRKRNCNLHLRIS